MTAFLQNTILVLVVWLALAGVSFGKQVYLKDGGVIVCQSFERRNGVVFVKINRDTVITLEQGEVNLKPTFPQHSKKDHHLKQGRRARGTVHPRASTPVPSAKESPVPTRPVPAVVASNADPVAVTSPTDSASIDPTPTSPVEASAPPVGVEPRKLAAQMMAEAIEKQDPDLLKKAIQIQKTGALQDPSAKGYLLEKIRRSTKLLLAFAVIVTVSLWFVFTKAGESGVASLIPFYNMYVLTRISGKPEWWFFLLFIPIIGSIAYIMTMVGLAHKFQRASLFGVGLVLLPFLFLPLLAFGDSRYEG